MIHCYVIHNSGSEHQYYPYTCTLYRGRTFSQISVVIIPGLTIVLVNGVCWARSVDATGKAFTAQVLAHAWALSSHLCQDPPVFPEE